MMKVSVRAIFMGACNTDPIPALLMPEARKYLAKNSTDRVYMETEGEVLFRTMERLIAAADLDASKPKPAGQPSHVDEARAATWTAVDAKPPLKRLTHSPLLTRFLIEIEPFGETFLASCSRDTC